MSGRAANSLCLALVIAFLLPVSPLFAIDWPQWLGPRGNNIADDDNFVSDLSQWKVLWKANVGQGYSSVTVAEGLAIALGYDGNSQETVYCFDATSGVLQWKYSYNAAYVPPGQTPGPRASATIVGNKVITLGQDGQVFCLSAANVSSPNGTLLWATKLPGLPGMSLPPSGITSSPIAENGQVFFSAGQVASLDVVTGKILWVSDPTSPPTYATPVFFTQGGKDFVAVMDAGGVAIRSAARGDFVTRAPFHSDDASATVPLVFDDGAHILVSANSHTKLFAFNGVELTPVWDNKAIHNILNDSVVQGGVIYGVNSQTNAPGTELISLNTADCTVNWINDKFGYGSLIGVGNNLLAVTASGDLVTIASSSGGFSETSRLHLLGPNCLSSPSYAEGRLYVRNDKGDVVCLGR